MKPLFLTKNLSIYTPIDSHSTSGFIQQKIALESRVFEITWDEDFPIHWGVSETSSPKRNESTQFPLSYWQICRLSRASPEHAGSSISLYVSATGRRQDTSSLVIAAFTVLLLRNEAGSVFLDSSSVWFEGSGMLKWRTEISKQIFWIIKYIIVGINVLFILFLGKYLHLITLYVKFITYNCVVSYHWQQYYSHK